MTNLEFDKISEKLAYIAGPDSNDNLIIDYNDAIEYIKLFVDYYDKLIIEELTKVKAIIASMPNDNPSYWNKCDVVDRKAIFDLLDKRISKLEGKDIKEEFVDFCKDSGLDENAITKEEAIQWIPTYERQPEHTGDYLVTMGINYDGAGMFDCIRVASYNTCFGWGLYEKNDIHTLFGEITAWAELPKIYS